MSAVESFQSRYYQYGLFDRQGRFLDGDQVLAATGSLQISAIGEPVERIDDFLVLRRPQDDSIAINARWSDAPSAAYLLVRFDGTALRRLLESIGGAWGMTSRQVDLVEALMETGGLREAALLLGIGYVSARNTLAEIKSKTGLETIPFIIGQMFEMAGLESGTEAPVIGRHDVFGLTERQYAIASGIGVFKSRGEIARRLRISEAIVDAEIKTIYLVLGVRSAGEVTRFMAETRLSLAQAAPMWGGVGAHRHDLPMSRLTHTGRNIGYSDYGPADGQPVVILHSTITTRAPPTRLVDALQRSGFRPISVDRPGFGDTDFSEAGAGGRADDPYVLAADDLARVYERLGLSHVDMIARGSGHAAIRLAQINPALVGRVILVNPTPAIAFTSIDRGPLGAVKRRFARSPRAAEAMIRLLAAYATPRRMHDGMTRSFRGSAPDEALVRDDPQFLADYLRATRSFADDLIKGYVAEQTVWASGFDVAPMRGMAHWRIVQGGHFVLHHPELAMRYWRERLPDTPIDWIEEAGQMLAYSHPDAVVAALRD